jgi:hypothetical protein
MVRYQQANLRTRRQMAKYRLRSAPGQRAKKPNTYSRIKVEAKALKKSDMTTLFILHSPEDKLTVSGSLRLFLMQPEG